MGTMLASAIISRAGTIIQDETNVRWTTDELLQWLNDGQREVVLHKPSSNPTDDDLSLVAGTVQYIPSEGFSLIDVIRNNGGTKRSIRVIEREILDAQRPEWHDETASAEVKHYMFDPRNPRRFLVYPPNDGDGDVLISFGAAPSDVILTDPITLSDIYSNALLDYIIYRATMKDADYTLNDQRSQSAYQTFLNSLGMMDQRRMVEEPNVVTRSNISPKTTG